MVGSAQPLRQLADQRGIRIGAAAAPTYFSESQYGATLAREFNQLEPENAMKFGPIHPGPTSYNFDPADTLVNFAKPNNMSVRGHTLVWHNQLPSWLTGGGFTPAQLSSQLQDHIRTVMGRYAGQVYAWDVVNEAFNDNGTLRSTLWSDSPGIGLTATAYIEQAFRWAHDADPKALLFYNDYGAELTNAKSDAIYAMVQDFKSRGVPFDGVGLQMHLTTNTGSLASMEANLRRLTGLGVQVQITELDVRIPVDSSGNATAADLATQAQIYHDIVALCLKFSRCTAVQTWGFTDEHSWIPGTYPGLGAALEFDTNYQPKAAYTSMTSAFQSAPPVLASATLANAASYASQAVAPGEVVVLFGATYGPAALAVSQPDESGHLPTEFSGTRLWFDNTPAPIVYTRVGQTAAVVPFEVANQTATQVSYEHQSVRSDSVTIPVAPTLPGIFTLDASGRGAGAILDPSYRVVSQTNPAHRGDFISLFATGGGVTNPPSFDGLVLVQPPFAAIDSVHVAIGGIDCPVQYAGGASGLVAGVFQVNVQVPATALSGPQPILLTVGPASSAPGVTVWVQ
jgi:endo-1,4-beta-xylanase